MSIKLYRIPKTGPVRIEGYDIFETPSMTVRTLSEMPRLRLKPKFFKSVHGAQNMVEEFSKQVPK